MTRSGSESIENVVREAAGEIGRHLVELGAEKCHQRSLVEVVGDLGEAAGAGGGRGPDPRGRIRQIRVDVTSDGCVFFHNRGHHFGGERRIFRCCSHERQKQNERQN